MVLEAVVYIIDGSDYMRNGDYSPTRTIAQGDAVIDLANVSLSGNHESTVALLSTGGGVTANSAKTKVLLTLSTDPGALIQAISSLEPRGTANIITAVNIARLILKHAIPHANKRIVVFLGSPVAKEVVEELPTTAQLIHNDSVEVDVVAFGEAVHANESLVSFVNTAKHGNTCRYVSVPQGESISSYARSAFGLRAAQVNNDLDPELNEAIRQSMIDAGIQPEQNQQNDTEMDEEEMVRRAIEMSLQENETQDSAGMEEMDEETRLAIEMSLMSEGQSILSTTDTDMSDPQKMNEALLGDGTRKKKTEEKKEEKEKDDEKETDESKKKK